MAEMRILPYLIGGKRSYLVTNLQTAEEAGSVFLNIRTAGKNFFGFHSPLKKAVEVFKKEVKKQRPDITDKELEEMVQKETEQIRS